MFARPGLPSFEYLRATSPDKVVCLLQEHGEAARLLMGGTDLFPQMRDGAVCPRVVVDVKSLPGMRDILYREGVGLTVGAAVTMNELVRHPDIQAHYPLLAEAAETVASYQIRNRATLGGNLCNASPCADTAPAILALEAELSLYGPDGGQRSVPAIEFFLGPGQTAMQAGEFLTAVRFPPSPSASGRYIKLGRCKSGDLSLVGVAVYGYPDGGVSGYRFRIALGSVAPTPLRAVAAEELLAANPPGEEVFDRAAEKAMAEASPITDVRGSAAYQRAMVRILTRRALHAVWAQLPAPT